MSVRKWIRPKSVPFPQVWHRCPGRDPSLKFRVQDVTEDLFEDVILHMTLHYLKDEPMSKSIGFTEDLTSVRENQDLWRQRLKRRLSLVMVVDDERTSDKQQIAAVTIAEVRSKGESHNLELRGPAMRTIDRALNYSHVRVNIYDRFQVLEYVSAIALAVNPKYRGQGLGLEILRSQYQLNRALGLPVTANMFTVPQSQSIGLKCGTQLLLNTPYSEYKEEGKVVFPDLAGSMMFLAKVHHVSHM